MEADFWAELHERRKRTALSGETKRTAVQTEAQPSDSDSLKGLPLDGENEAVTGQNREGFSSTDEENEQKWTAHDYPDEYGKPKHLLDWKPPRLVFAVSDIEKDALNALKDAFQPLAPYTDTTQATGLETTAIANEKLVETPTPIPPGHIVFLENTAERCTSPTTKHDAPAPPPSTAKRE